MRNIYFLFLLFISTNLVKAQTITPDWFFADGDSLQSIIVTNFSDFEAPTEGLNQIWDYSSILTSPDTTTINFVAPGTLTTFQDFERANIAAVIPGLQEVFYSTEGDTLSILGVSILGGPYGVIQFEYGQGNTELIGADQMVFGDTLFQTITADILVDGNIVQTFEADQTLGFNGVGSLQLPETTLDNCILLKNSIIQDGQLTGEISTIYFNSLSNQVLTYQRQFNPTTNSFDIAMAKGATDDFTVSIAAVDLLQANIFSDMTGNIYIEMEEAIDASVQIISLDGHLIENNETPLTTGRNKLNTTANYASGIYVVLVIDKNTGRFNSHKMFIQK